MGALAPVLHIKDSTKTKSNGKNIFTFNPVEYQEEFAKNGFVLIKNGINSDFLAVAIEQAEKQKIGQKELNNCFFKGKKRQYLYGFENWDFQSTSIETLAKTARLPVHKMTLYERHIKVYEPDANAHVPAHKDRVATQLTVGIPLFIPENSHIVLWPDNDLAINSLNSTALWCSSLDENELPENILKDIKPVRVYADPGDVVIFRGNSIHHEMENPANARLLYLKVNAMRLEPMGEDQSTLHQQKSSQKILRQLDDRKLLNCLVEVSPRLEKISWHYTRLYWKEVIQAYVACEKEFTLSEIELEVFKKVEGQETVREVISRLEIPEHVNYVPMVRRLASLKGLDVIAPIF